MACALTISAIFVLGQRVNADWPQFRGNNSCGIGSGKPPTNFGPGKNELWKTPLGSGHSSPCIAGDRIFLTTCDKENLSLSVVCLNRDDGKVVWKRSVTAEKFEKGHPSFNAASSSPCCDDEYVVTYFGSYGLVAYDHEGNMKWEKRLPVTKSFGGNAASPIIAGDKVILYRGNYVDHYLWCLNKNTGEEVWKVPLTEKINGEMACTACPILVGKKLICHTARSVRTYHVDTGDMIWIAKCATTATSTPVVVGNEVLVAAWNKLGEPDLRPPFPKFDELLKKHDKDGDDLIERKEFPKLWIFHRPDGIEAPMNGAPVSFKHADKNKNDKIEADEWARTTKELEDFRSGYESHGALAIPIASQGMVSAKTVRTLTTSGIPEVPSPVSDGEHLYLVKNGGSLTCVEIKSGEIAYRKRTKGKGTHYASPLIADGKLYTFAGNGRVSVIKPGTSFEILAVNEMKDEVYATPAIVEGVIYLRTHSALHAFGLEDQ